MTVQLIHADDITPQPWKNGGGQTRELLAWPSPDDWSLRISVADIDADGPFSAFTGVQRWFAVVDGAGVELQFADATRRITSPDPPLRFDGGMAPHCRLIDGRTRDLNLMLRGARGSLRVTHDGVQWGTAARQCGLFAAVPGVWACADHRRIALPARTLLWMDQAPALAHAFKATQRTDRVVGWWLEFTP